jgi:SAM-dependent methyltransferase
MTTTQTLRHMFSAGYDSGNILSRIPNRRRRYEEGLIHGSYRRFFMHAVRPHLQETSMVMELGPGRGSWTRAILKHVPRGQVHALDYVDAAPWLHPEKYEGRLVVHRTQDNSFACVDDENFDVFFSFGVLCHNTAKDLAELMANALPKMRPGGVAIHQYGDWEKLDRLGWHDDRHGVPPINRDLDDEHEWNFWPRNDQSTMARICSEAGWIVEQADLDLFKRDSVILLRAPGR